MNEIAAMGRPAIAADLTVSRPGASVTVRYGDAGFITGRVSNGIGRIDAVFVEEAWRNDLVGTELYRRLLTELGDPSTVVGNAGGVNAEVLENGGSIYDTSRARILSRLGYTEHEIDGNEMISRKR